MMFCYGQNMYLYHGSLFCIVYMLGNVKSISIAFENWPVELNPHTQISDQELNRHDSFNPCNLYDTSMIQYKFVY